MSRILIAGCGYVGEAAADLFHERGWEVKGWTASAESARRLGAKPYSVRNLDITDAGAMSSVRREFDVIVQCASSRGGDAEEYRRIYLDGARVLLRVFPGAKHLFTSSTSVYGQRHGIMVDETSTASPAHERGRILREAEELVLAHGGIVARLAGIYGPGRSFILRTFLDGNALLDRENDRFINQAHRDDIVTALFLLVERRADLGGQVYNVVDDEPILRSDAFQWLSGRLQRSLSTGTFPTGKKRGDTNKRVSNRKLRSLGWKPRFPNFSAGMTNSVLASFEIGGRSSAQGRYGIC